MSADAPGYAFIILLRHQGDALGVSRLLSELRHRPSEVRSSFLVPPVRGLSFFADRSEQNRLDAWWAASVPNEARLVYLVEHEPGLPEWLPGLDGHFYVGLPVPGLVACYPTRITTFTGTHALDYARVVMRDHCTAPAMVFAPHEAARLAGIAGELPGPDAVAGLGTVVPDTEGGYARDQAPTGEESQSRGTALTSSLRLLDRRRLPTKPRTWRWSLSRVRGGTGRTPLLPPQRADPSARGIAHAMLRRGTTIVVIGSRKGGVGKTSYAAGVAIQAGQILDTVGHTACLVDANLANPDAWGQMSLPVRAATVRQVVAALAAGQEPLDPIHAQTPALACYPESREASEYSKTDIDRFAAYLRQRYTFIVVDMSNRLPDPLGGPEAAVAAYWLERADVIVLPTTSSKQDFNGVLDYLDVAGLPPVVVPYIVPKGRRNRDHQVTHAYLGAIRSRVHQLVEIPDQADQVRLAGMENLPVERVSPALRRAYRRLTEAAVAVPPRAGISRE